MYSIVRHRRTGRPFPTGRIVAIVSVAALLAGAGVVYLVRQASGCSGTPVTLNIAASPDHAPVMETLAGKWNSGEPTVAGQCAQVAVRAVAPAAVAAALGPGWDETRDGVRPDVWAPDSSSWLLVVQSRPEAASILPTSPPVSLASSPVVLAMQRSMAEAVGWPGKDIDLAELMKNFVGGGTWERFGHPEWGPLQVGMVDPRTSSAGLAGVLGVLDPNNDNTMSSEELLGGVAFTQFVSAFAPDTETLFESFRQPKQDQALPAVFPAYERDVAKFAAGQPPVALVPVYPRQGAAFADYPFAVLRAPWVDGVRTQIANEFLAHLRGNEAQLAYAAAGFRDASHAVGPNDLLTAERGFRAAAATSVRQPNAEALGQLLGMWTVLQRQNNVLLTLDTSGSMKEVVPGANITRLQMLQRAALEGIALLTNQTNIGLWEFSSKLTPTTDHRELVPVGLAGDKVGPITRRQALNAAISGLKANGATGLYDTILAAYGAMQKQWLPNAQNLMVVITDGKNEDAEGITLDLLTQKLKAMVRADQPLWVIAIAVGPQADAAALESITKVTGGSTFVAKDDVSAIQQIILAFAGRLS